MRTLMMSLLTESFESIVICLRSVHDSKDSSGQLARVNIVSRTGRRFPCAAATTKDTWLQNSDTCRGSVNIWNRCWNSILLSARALNGALRYHTPRGVTPYEFPRQYGYGPARCSSRRQSEAFPRILSCVSTIRARTDYAVKRLRRETCPH
jgi:hypothetical protein